MGKPVYKLFKVRFREAWYQLDAEEQNALMEKVGAALDAVGGKRIILCDSQWSSDCWGGFGVEEFPHAEAQRQHTALLQEINWFRYVEGDTLLGTEWVAQA